MPAAISSSGSSTPSRRWACAMPLTPQPLPAGGAARTAVAASPLAELEDLYCRHHARLLQTAYRVVGNRTDAEDVLQTVFLRLARDGGQLGLRPGNELGGYLHRMTVHAAIDCLRRRKPQPAEGAVERLTHPAPDPERAHHSQELQAALRAAVARLGGRAAEIFVLRYWEDLDNTEIARRLGVPRVTIGVTLHRARRQLRQVLSRYWGVTS